eukprot:943150-Rhodomonas_salina.1
MPGLGTWTDDKVELYVCADLLCGNSVANEWEGCDDNNLDYGDGCSGVCTVELLPQDHCDLVQACGISSNQTCNARQGTFLKYNDPGPDAAVDSDAGTCMSTADAINDPSPQWFSVDLEHERLVGTVLIHSPDAASDIEVLVSTEAAAVVEDGNGNVVQNPAVGGAIPVNTEACTVRQTASGVLEALCPPATKGQVVFVRRLTPHIPLVVCEIEVFGHKCLDQVEEVSCGLGYEPSRCQSCGGCVPCANGWYSDQVGDYSCTPCPGSPRPYSPEGSTSVFQCEGDAILDGTSALEVSSVSFSTALDSWVIEIEFSIAPRIEINGLSGFFMSKGGSNVKKTDPTWLSRNFPCRADTSVAAGSDLSASLAESVCCLQDMRQDYVMTKIFRDFTDGLDLVAANDRCDAADGSEMLVNADLDLIGEEGTIFVDTEGNVFSNAITIEQLPATIQNRRSDGSETQRAKITIPDAELHKVSRTLNPDGNLTDSRELFVGLLDMLPTGTRVVDSTSQQISIVLTRTQYGTFAAYGEQNIDYDFIIFLNARAHRVVNQIPASDDNRWGDQFYAEVTFVYDDHLQPVNAVGAAVVDSVTVTIDGEDSTPCSGEPAVLEPSFAAVVVDQDCGPKHLAWGEVCPQVSILDDFFGRLYIPLPDNLNADVIHIEFDLWFEDKGLRSDKIQLAMDLVVSDFVTWCDAASGSVDLAQRVVPRIIVGTKSANPPRLEGWEEMKDGEEFSTGAETLQDGL